MIHFPWDRALETGVELIDDEHRGLFSLANALQDAIESDTCDDETIANAIYSLTEYVTQHFSDEEDLMHEMGYPILGPRRSLHEQLTGDTMRYMAAYFNGQQVAASELGPFLTTWLRTHIQHEDMRFATWLRQREEA